MKIVITCGGTGGHFFPGLAIARSVDNSEVKLLLSGIHSVEQAAIAGKFGISAVELPEMPSPGSLKKFFRFFYGLTRGFFIARRELKKFVPDAVIGMGSFASLPVALAARSLHIPLFLHDGNARIGKANRVLSRFAKALGAGFPPVNGNACRCEIVDCGMPVRPELVSGSALSKAQAIEKLNEITGYGFTPDKPLLLVFGGSQGALAINSTLPAAVAGCAVKDLQIVHLTGRGKLEECQKFYQASGVKACLLETSGDMDVMLSAADVVVSRSGGSSVAELALFGKAALLIPYPYAAEHHQDDNAAFFCNSGAGKMILQSLLTAEKIADFLNTVFLHPEIREDMANRAAQLARPCAAQDFLAAIEKRI